MDLRKRQTPERKRGPGGANHERDASLASLMTTTLSLGHGASFSKLAYALQEKLSQRPSASEGRAKTQTWLSGGKENVPGWRRLEYPAGN